jgi:hypothetical protein
MNNLKQHLRISGILFTVVVVLWPVMMVISRAPEHLDEAMIWIQSNRGVFRLQFFLAMLISPAALYLLTSLLHSITNRYRPMEPLGWLFLGAYVVLTSISYGAQAILVPGLLASGRWDLAGFWYFESPHSISYFLNQLGYAFFGAGVIILFSGFLRCPGWQKTAGYLLVISGALSILAFLGLFMEVAWLNFLTMISGILMLPLGILTIVVGYKDTAPG